MDDSLRTQIPLFDVRRFRPNPYPEWSFFGVLEKFAELIIWRSDFPEFDGTRGGPTRLGPGLGGQT